MLIARTWDAGVDKRLAILSIKPTGNGDLSWTRLIGDGDRDLGVSSLFTLADGSFVVVGGASGSGANGSDSAFTYFDQNGNPLSSVTLHAPPLGGFHLISHDTDGRFVLGGRSAKGGRSLATPSIRANPQLLESVSTDR